MKRVFVSHPYKNDPEGNKKRADAICKELAEKKDILPISPLHLFSFMVDDEKREEILQVCFRLIDICDEVWIYGDSEGCRKEAEYARRVGEVVRVYGRDMGAATGRNKQSIQSLCEVPRPWPRAVNGKAKEKLGS